MRSTKKPLAFPADEIDERAERMARIRLATHLADVELAKHKQAKSDAEKEEEERARKANMPWYARLFGTECCGNRGRKKDEKRNDGATASD